MKKFIIAGLLFLLLIADHVNAQYQQQNPNLDQVPQYLIEKASENTVSGLSSVVTIGNWDNFSLGFDFAENNMAENPGRPTWFFTAYNINNPHHTENGIDWFVNEANFGSGMRGDPVVAYDSIGNLFYENMFGSQVAGSKVIASANNGATWGPPVTAVAGNDKCWIACDQTSGPYANYVYATMSNSGVGNFARSTDHGATFTPTFAPASQELPGMMVCVGPQANIQGGAVYVVTNGGDSFNSVYTFYLSNDGGATFMQQSSWQWANTVGTQVEGRNSVSNMRTRPYPMIAADNSYGPNRGKVYCVYASNDPPGDNHKSDIFCRSSADGGVTWSDAVKVNDDVNTENFQQWHPAIWCDKETGKMYAMWMDTRDTPTNDSAYIYASWSDDGGATFIANQRISNEKMKIDCGSCGGGGTPRYEGDYNGVVSNRKSSLIGWTDFRAGSFQSMTAYFPDFAMAIDKSSDTLYWPLSVPEVKLYSDTVMLSGSIFPVPSTGTITFEYPSGTTMTTFPDTRPVKLVLEGDVPGGTYLATLFTSGPNGTPVHKRTVTIRVFPEVTASSTPDTICEGQTSQLECSITGGTPPYTYVWDHPESLNNPNIANPVATPSESTMYHVVITDLAGHICLDSTAVEINTGPSAPGPITGSQLVCAGNLSDYSIVEVVGGTTYSWSIFGDAAIVSGQNTPNVTVQWGNISGNLTVIAGNECGNNPLASVLPVVVEMQPAALHPIAGPDTVCKNTNVKFHLVSADHSLIFNWSVPDDAMMLSGQGTDTLHVTWGATDGTISVFAQNGCGRSDTALAEVRVTSVPDTAGIINGKDTVCQGHGNYIYSVHAITGATHYEWTVPAGVTITAGMG
ncbi:MAG: hypothetical protein NTW16_17830 [Bacteroidetes bacterium]|nr:hypothetical protein [Bacteroidota bacterium]